VDEDVAIRPFRDGDSVRDITTLLHDAYAPLLAQGLRYLATHQDEATTLRRLMKGFPFVAEQEGAIVGTITLYGPKKDSPCEWYNRDGVFKFGQYAVRPDLQRRGIGLALLSRAEEEARARGGSEFALDTSEKAAHLIRWYDRLGFRFIQHVSWNDTNYRSVVLSKSLSLPPHPTSAIPPAS
jgi:GNAT superfamily N-acetyltransferase